MTYTLTLRDCIAELSKCWSVERISSYADSLPLYVREDIAFMEAVRERLRRISKVTKKA